jgi:hypothetical protein
MASDEGDQIIDQVEAQARYEALREVVHQLAGVLVARQRTAPADQRALWRDEHRAVRARLRTIEPATADVDEALDRWSARLRELRATSDR